MGVAGRTRLAALVVVAALGGPLVLSGCGKHKVATPAEAQLENEDFLAVVAALSQARAQVQAEVAATRAAWPKILAGLPARPGAGARAKIHLAARKASEVRLAPLLDERGAASLTGPASPLAGRFRSYQRLGARSWQLIESSLEEIEHGSPAAARFARENLPLYVEGVYDAHYTLAQTGKQLLAAYNTLGASKTFGSSLTEAELNGLASSYSEERNRLSPKERVKLGS
ncbi:MAG TPA: hypothetical protein VFI66_07960 [Gemmatimonadales bacterium]|nr:hypothetical protein [Gemmatimonadales bacterium]